MPTCKVLFFLLFALSCVKCNVLYHKVGDEAVMKCNVASDSDVDWKLDDELIIHTNGKRGTRRKGNAHVKDKVSVNGGTLKVPRLETKDSGVYICSQTAERYTLHVVSVFAKPGPVLLQSSKAELHCEVTGNPGTYVTWQRPSKDKINDKKQVIELKSVTSNEDGEWTCMVKDLTLKLTLTVIGGLLTKAVEVSEGDTAELPCSLPEGVSHRVVGGKWTADHLPTGSFPTLTNSESKGLHWNGGDSSKVNFTIGQISTNYDVTLLNVQRSHEGKYVCTVQFEGGAELTAKTNLTVVAKSSGEQEILKAKKKTSAGGGTLTKDMFGLQLWVWIAICSVVLIGLTVGIVLTLLRNKQKKKRVKRLRSMRQPLTAKVYCKCKRDESEVDLEQREKPLLVPRQQRNPRTRAEGHDYMIEKSKAQDY